MRDNLLLSRQLILNEEVQEPTLLAMLVAVIGSMALLCVSVVAIVGMPAFGYTWWIFATVAAILVWLVAVPGRKSLSGPLLLSGRRQWHDRIHRWTRRVFITVLACWLGLIVWLTFCPGGPTPPTKGAPHFIRVITWNIHVGQDKGPPWKQFDWRERKLALQEAIDQAKPDIFCVQEATAKQVKFLDEMLQGFSRIGVSSNGGSSGEFCSIYFNRQRFTEIDSDTFWLQEPLDQPRAKSLLDFNRICTWVRLRDQVSGRTLRVYNTHFALTEASRRKAAQVVVAQIAAGDPTDAIVLTGDFNASPTASSRRRLLKDGLEESAVRAGKSADEPTFQIYGIGLQCFDGILVDAKWTVPDHHVLTVKPRNIFPSDHFAILADLAMIE